MIVKTILDFSSISYDGNKISNSAHAAYWLASQHSEDCDSALKLQEKLILEAFHKMAASLGYRVEKIAPEEPVVDTTPTPLEHRYAGLISPIAEAAE